MNLTSTSSTGFKYSKYKSTAEEILRIGKTYEVGHYVIESMYMSIVSRPLMMSAEHRAVIMAECTTHAPIYELSAIQAKKTILGSRNKEFGEKYTKKQMIDGARHQDPYK